MFSAHKSDLSAMLSSPPLSPNGQHTLAGASDFFSSQQSQPKDHSTDIGRRRSLHRRTDSALSASLSFYPSPARSISRPHTPDEHVISSDPHSDSLPSKSSLANTNRWSVSSVSGRHASEQEQLLQEKLQQLARSENARLSKQENISTSGSRSSSRANSRPASYISTSSTSGNSIPINAFQKSHSRTRSLQPYFNSNDMVPELAFARQSTAKSPTRSPEQSPSRSANALPLAVEREAARAAALAQLSGDIAPKHSRKSVPAPLMVERETTSRLKRRLSLQSPGQFVISSKDLQKLAADDSEQEYSDDAETNRQFLNAHTKPAELTGNALSWRMASDLVRSSGKIYKSPETLYEVLRYLSVLISNPSTMTDVDASETQWLPPSELVVNLKNNFVHLLMQITLRSIFDACLDVCRMFGRGACTCVAFSIIFFQMCLLSLMVFAYVIGDLLMDSFSYVKNRTLGKTTTEASLEDKEQAEAVEKSSEDIAKANSRKAQRAAKKAILRRSKRR